MAVPSSGELELYGDIGTELGVAQSNVTLHGMSQTAGFTPPDAMSEFYGYDPTPPVPTSFNTVIYSGTGTGVGVTQSITGVGFQPDLVWVKSRTSSAFWHNLADSVRGVDRRLFSNTTNAEDYDSSGTYTLLSFDSDGFTVGRDNNYNSLGTNNYVAWCFKAGGAAVTNTAGTITSQVSANVAAGFSVVTCTATGGVDTIGHGLGVAPSVIIYKTRSTTGNWSTYHQSLGNTRGVYLNLTSAVVTSTFFWNNTSPTSDVFTAYGSVGNTHIAYCFAEKAGFSKFGSYVGTGVSGQSITGLGFEPAFLIIKNIDDGTTAWRVWDNKRPVGALLAPSSSQEEVIVPSIRLDSDGFTLESVNTQWNNSGKTFIYMEFDNQF